LIDPTPAAYKEISRFEIARGPSPTWASPAVANGQLYLREQTNLYCYTSSGDHMYRIAILLFAASLGVNEDLLEASRAATWPLSRR